MTMVEDIILAVDLNQAAVGIARAHSGMLCIRNAGQADVTAADKDTAVFKTVIRIIAHRIAEVMAVKRAVDEVVLPVELAHGAGFSEGLLLIGGALGLFSCKHADISKLITGNHRHHVAGVNLEEHGAVLRGLGSVQKDGVPAESKTGV